MPRACPPGEALDRPWSGTTCKAAARVARASLALRGFPLTRCGDPFRAVLEGHGEQVSRKSLP